MHVIDSFYFFPFFFFLLIWSSKTYLIHIAFFHPASYYFAEFHAVCVDSWLTTWKTFCPVCKQDAKSRGVHPPASESTPLLAPISACPSSPAGSLAASPPIVPLPPWTPSASLAHSRSSTCIVNLHKSSINSPIGNTSADLRNASSRRSHTSHLLSARLLGFPLSSPFYSQYISYIPSSSNASPSYLVRSSSMYSCLQHYESEASLSALASTQSLPGCWFTSTASNVLSPAGCGFHYSAYDIQSMVERADPLQELQWVKWGSMWHEATIWFRNPVVILFLERLYAWQMWKRCFAQTLPGKVWRLELIWLWLKKNDLNFGLNVKLELLYGHHLTTVDKNK